MAQGDDGGKLAEFIRCSLKFMNCFLVWAWGAKPGRVLAFLSPALRLALVFVRGLNLAHTRDRMEKHIKNLSREPAHPHSSTGRFLWSGPKSSNAWASLHCCLCWPELSACGYTPCFGKHNAEWTLKRDLPSTLQTNATHCRSRWVLTGQVLTRGHQCETFCCYKGLTRKTRTKKSNCWVNPAHSWSSWLKTLNTSALLFPNSLLPPGQYLLYHSPQQLPLPSPFSPLAMGNQRMKQGIPRVIIPFIPIIPSMPPLWTSEIILPPEFSSLSWLLLSEIAPRSSAGLCVC